MLLRPTPDPGVDCDGGKPVTRSPTLRLLETGGTLPVLRREFRRETSVFVDRVRASTRRSVFGFPLGFVRVGVDDAGADARDETADAAEGEGVSSEVGARGESGRRGVVGKLARLLTEPFCAPRPLTAAPSLIHPGSFSFNRALRFRSFCRGVGGEGGEASCNARRANNRRLGDSVRASSSLSLSTSRRTARILVSVRVFHFSVPPE